MLTLLFNQAQQGGSGNFSLTGIPSSEAFGSLTWSAAATLALTGVASGEAFGTATWAATISLGQTGIASAEAFGTVTWSAAASLSQTGISSGEAFGSATISTGGAAGLTLAGIPSGEAFGSLTWTTGTAPLSLTGIGSAEAFGTTQWSAAAALTQSGISSAEAFGSAAVSGSGTAVLSLAGILSAETFGLLAVSGATTALAALSGLPTAESFGTLTVGGTVALPIFGIPSAEAFGVPALAYPPIVLALAGLPSAEAFGILTFRSNARLRITIFPNGQVLTSMAITPQALSSLLQTLTCQMLGIDPSSDPLAYSKVRLGWPEAGQPSWGINDDVCFLKVTEEDDPYNRVRDRTFGTQSGSFGSTDTYTRVWRIAWSLYGPNSFDNARLIKSALFAADFAHDTLAANSMYLVSDVPATRRAPEKFQNQWWDRSDLDIRLNELITESLTLNSISTAQVLVYTDNGEVENIQAPAPAN